MTLRTRVFLRTYALLAILTVAICATTSVSLLLRQRNAHKQDAELTALFIAENAAKFILWDDRIGLRSLLDEAIKINPVIEYAFVEIGRQPYVHTMPDGVPRGLLACTIISAARQLPRSRVPKARFSTTLPHPLQIPAQFCILVYRVPRSTLTPGEISSASWGSA